MIEIIKYSDNNFSAVKDKLIKNKMGEESGDLEKKVREILDEVRLNRDQAVLKYIQLFEGPISGLAELRVNKSAIKTAYKNVNRDDLSALKNAARRIKEYHQKQFAKEAKSWRYKKDGVELGQLIRPLERAGVYVPGGKANYPSSVLMGVIPAKVAGVEEVILCTPYRKEGDNPYTLVAADLAGADKIFRVGGAQAIAAMAYGTEQIPKTDKIVGPGNIFVTLAKKMVFGLVDIDMLAGPTEIVIIGDEKSNPEYLAADLLSQAEHDERALPILITTSERSARKVSEAISRQMEDSLRRAIMEKSLREGKIFVVKNLSAAIDLSNEIAPEHLALNIENPHKILPRIKNAGAIFLGEYTPQSVGDYIAGPNHVLPTGNTARFSSPLGVNDFIKRMSLIASSKNRLQKWEKDMLAFARMEGLEAHGRSVSVRLQNNNSKRNRQKKE